MCEIIADMERACDAVTDLGHVVVTIKRERRFQEIKGKFKKRINMMNRKYKEKKKKSEHRRP